MRPALLDNLHHADLRLDVRLNAEWGDAVSAVPTVPAEFQALQGSFPIVFKDAHEGAGLQAVALLALTQEHSRFIADGTWQAAHLPWALERQPLLVGRDGERWVVHIDLDSPRLGAEQGEALFLPHGSPSPVLERRVAVLQALHEGLQGMQAFVEALLSHQLLEPLTLDIPSPNGSLHRVGGFSVINQDRLTALPGRAVADLHEAGHLLPIHMALASMARFRDLIAQEQVPAAGANT
jgi:hypothetical protein